MSSPAGKPMLLRTGDEKLIRVVLGQQLTAIQPTVSTQVVTPQISTPEAARVVTTSSLTDATMTAIRPVPNSANKIVPSILFVGDLVKVTSEFAAEKSQTQDALNKFVAAAGTVQFVAGRTVVALFNDLEKRQWSCDSSSFIKQNVLSVNQIVRIRSDDHTAKEIEKQFENLSERLKGAIGQVTGIDYSNPCSHIFVLFDNADIYDWLTKAVPLPSSWMDVIQPVNLVIEKERLYLASKLVALFFTAVEEGDLRNAKLLHDRHGVDAKARNTDGKTALHLATQRGYKELIDWLLNEAHVDVDQTDLKGYRAIHFAILQGSVNILETLLANEAEVDGQTICGRTALHFSVLKEFTKGIGLLMDFEADPNLQDEDGNTPLHVAILHGNEDVLNELTSVYNFRLGLRNKNGLNAIQLAVQMNDFSTVKYLMEDEGMCDPLLDLMANSQSTVLHYVCTYKKFEMVKLLVAEAKDWIMLDELPLLGKLLEARNEKGETALLIACRNKDFALVELLVESGADLKAVDEDGNTAILLAASSTAPDDIPSKENSPSIFKIYEGALVDSSDTRLMVERHPILSLIAYLMAKGSSLEAANKAGKSGTSAVMSKDSPSIIAKALFKLLFKIFGKAPSGSSCMGRMDCSSQPAFHLHCPHKPSYKACSKCFLLNSEKLKCGCPEEDVASISPAGFHGWLDLSMIREEIPAAELQAPTSMGFNWIQDGSKNGFLEDQLGSRYKWSGTRRDGSVGYRCDKEGCRAVARRIKLEGGSWVIRLEVPHDHPAGLKRKMLDEPKMMEEGSTGQPSNKKERS